MPQEEQMSGPIMDAIKAKIAKIIEDPSDLIALIKLLISLAPKESTFSSQESAALVELIEMCESTQS